MSQEDSVKEEKQQESQATTSRKNYSNNSSKSTEIFGYKVNNNDLLTGGALVAAMLALGVSGWFGWNQWNANKKAEDEAKALQNDQIIAEYLRQQQAQAAQAQAQQQPPQQPQGYVDMSDLNEIPPMYQTPQPQPQYERPPIGDGGDEAPLIDMNRYAEQPQPPKVQKKQQLPNTSNQPEREEYPSTADLLSSMSGTY